MIRLLSLSLSPRLIKLEKQSIKLIGSVPMMVATTTSWLRPKKSSERHLKTKSPGSIKSLAYLSSSPTKKKFGLMPLKASQGFSKCASQVDNVEKRNDQNSSQS